MNHIATQPDPAAERHQRYTEQQDAARAWITSQLRQFLTRLDPYVDGTTGELNPRHLEIYLSALAQLGRTWAVTNAVKAPPPPPALEAEPEDPAAVEAARTARVEALRATAITELAALAAKADAAG